MEEIKQKGLRGLKWFERYTKTDMVYLAKGGFWNITSQIIVSASTFVLAIAFAHFVSKEVYGEYKFILSIASILGTFTLTGLGTAVLRAINRGDEGTMKYAFWENIKWSVLFFVLALGVSVYYFAHGNSVIGSAMLIVGSLSPFWNSTNLYCYYLDAKKDFKRSNIYFNVIGNLFPAAAMIVTVILTQNPILLVLSYFASNTLIGVILYLRVVKIYRPNDKTDKGILGYSKHLSFMAILGGVVGNLDQILVFHYVGAVELAIYNFATAIPSQTKGPMKGLSTLIFPKFVEHGDKEIRSGMRNKLIWLFLCAIGMIVVYILAAPWIFHVFFPKYDDAIFYSQVFSLSLLWIVSIPTDAYLVAKKKIKEQYIENTAVPIIQTVLLFVGIIWWGLLGLIVARVVISLISSAISIALYEKASKPSRQ